MPPRSVYKEQIRNLLLAFSAATVAGSPHTMAAMMCSDEAEELLDRFPDPDNVGDLAAPARNRNATSPSS